MEVRTGGLYRCCIETATKSDGHEGKIITCPFCKTKMIFKNEAWELVLYWLWEWLKEET
jgi:hypothetical protein